MENDDYTEHCPQCQSKMWIIGWEKSKEYSSVTYAVWHCDICNKDYNTHDLYMGDRRLSHRIERAAGSLKNLIHRN